MGFFRDMKKLSEQNKQVREAYPVSGLLAQAQQGMAAMSETLESLADQTESGVIVDGVHTTATVVAVRQAGAMVNFNPLVELDLLVLMPGGVPVPVTRKEVVLQLHLARSQPGQRVKVLVDPTNPARLAIDWVTPV